MKKKKILVILGHPDSGSFNGALQDAYVRAAKASGHEIKEIKLGDIAFDPILHKGYKTIQELEPDLVRAQKDIVWAEHLVMIFPTWWASFPAILKGFFDRVILPGFGFKYHKTGMLWDKLLKGRSARLITTMGAPAWYYRLFLLSPGIRAVKKGILEFCGVSPVRVTIFPQITKAPEAKLMRWIKQVEGLGRAAR